MAPRSGTAWHNAGLYWSLAQVSIPALYGIYFLVSIHTMMLQNCFIDFAVEHQFECRAAEPGFARHIGTIEIWLINNISLRWQNEEWKFFPSPGRVKPMLSMQNFSVLQSCFCNLLLLLGLSRQLQEIGKMPLSLLVLDSAFLNIQFT